LEAGAILAGPRVHRAWRTIAGASRRRSYYGDFSGARMSRLELDWIAHVKAADEEVKRDAVRLRARARELVRNNALAKNYIRLVRLNVVGAHGPQHQARIRDNAGVLNKRLNDRVEAAFDEWGSGPVTRDGRHTLVALEHQLAAATRCDGEALVRFWRGPAVRNDFGLLLEPIDADLLDHTYNRDRVGSENEVRMGVEIDEDGRPLYYHVWDAPLSYARQRNRLRIPASEILHLYDPERLNQSRGVTDFHPVTIALHFAGEYSHYELVAARVHAAKPIIWKRIVGATIHGEGDPSSPEDQRPIDELEPGTFGYAPDGYEPANVEIGHPTNAFESFMREQKREIASGLGVGYAALTSDLSNTSYSSARHGTLLERDTWRGLQQWFIRAFLRPVYAAWMREATLIATATGGAQGLTIGSRDTRDPRALLAAQFQPRGWDAVDPLKDANATIALVGNGLMSRTRAVAEYGIDIEDLFDELAEETRLAAALGISISDVQAAAAAKAAQAAADAEDAAQAVDDQAARASTNGHANRVAALTNGRH
jgi:lambda family phage portal protein